MLAQLDLNAIQQQGLPGNTIPMTLGAIISTILPYVYGAAGIALLIYLVIGGFQLMLAKGDPKAIQSAQGKITFAVIGFIIIILAVAITQLLGRLLNLPVFETIFGRGSIFGGHL